MVFILNSRNQPHSGLLVTWSCRPTVLCGKPTIAEVQSYGKLRIRSERPLTFKRFDEITLLSRASHPEVLIFNYLVGSFRFVLGVLYLLYPLPMWGQGQEIAADLACCVKYPEWLTP